MKNACRENRIPEPKYELSEREVKLIFYPSRIALLISEIEKAGIELNERQKEALEYAFYKGSISNKEYREAYKISSKTASLELSDMVRKELLRRIGKGRAVKYEPKI